MGGLITSFGTSFCTAERVVLARSEQEFGALVGVAKEVGDTKCQGGNRRLAACDALDGAIEKRVVDGQGCASREFRRNADDRFVLLDEQLDTYEHVAAALKKARDSDGRTAIIVEGGAGTGKTAVGLKASGEAFRGKLSSNYIVWQESFRDALKSASGLTTEERQQIFISPRGIELGDSRRGSMHLVICDEAHRLETNTDYRGRTSSDPQISEILHLSRVLLFLLDRHQNVKLSEIGTPERLEEDVERHGYKSVRLELATQMRSGGNAEYTGWVRRLLGLDEGEPGIWAPDQDFPVLLAEQPREIWEVLNQRTSDQNDFRIAAGYCWSWPGKKSGKKGKVKIGSWSMPWNYRKTEPDGPASGTWAYKRGGWGQVGCVHTFQGFEQKWVGVILGPDLVYRDGRIESVVEANEELRAPSRRDPNVRGRAEQLIRNIYYVLLTRGLEGIVIFACDDKLRAHLRTLIPTAEVAEAFMSPETWEKLKLRLQPRLAQAVDLALVTRAGVERAIPATKSHTTQLAAIAVVADALGPAEATLEPVLRSVPRPICTTCDACSLMTSSGHRYMFHEYRNWMTASAPITFHDSGSRTRTRNCTGFAPSSWAASDRSLGRLAKCCRNRNAPVADARNGIVSAYIVLPHPKPDTILNSAMIEISVGIISVISTNQNTHHLPGNRRCTNARPASSAVTVLPTVMTTAWMVEFKR
jgi:DUF2075 family protein